MSTAPVPMHLMRSAPPISSRRTRSRTSAGRRDDAEPEVVRQPDVVGQPDDVAAAPRRRDERARALHPRPLELAARDRVPQRDVDERAERADVAGGREARLDRDPGVAHGQERVLGRRGRRARHARRLDLADEVAVGVDEPGQDGEAAEVDDLGVVGRPVVGTGDRLDPGVPDEERPRPDEPARLDVEEVPGPDRERAGRVGEGGGLGIVESYAAAGGAGGADAYHASMTLPVPPDHLPFTGDREADELIAADPLALLIGFALDQQVTVQKAFSGPLELRRRIGSLDARTIATMDPEQLDAAFRTPPALHRFPGQHGRSGCGTCARRSPTTTATTRRRIWTGAADAKDLHKRLIGAARHRRDEGRHDRRAARQAVRDQARRLGRGRPEDADARRRRFGRGARGVPGGQAGAQGRGPGGRGRKA